MFYFVRTPVWLQRLYGACTWEIPGEGKVIYLTFDDGPHPEVTRYVLDELNNYNAKATFFCLGKRVAEYPELYQELLFNGHSTGNHTFDHLNGWKTNDAEYLENISNAGKFIHSNLFRPPYGRIRRSQINKISRLGLGENIHIGNDSPEQDRPVHIIMWTVLSGDFDMKLSEAACLENVIKNTTNGSIIVFHDSEKAYKKLQYTLPRVLEYFTGKGYSFEKII